MIVRVGSHRHTTVIISLEAAEQKQSEGTSCEVRFFHFQSSDDCFRELWNLCFYADDTVMNSSWRTDQVFQDFLFQCFRRTAFKWSKCAETLICSIWGYLDKEWLNWACSVCHKTATGSGSYSEGVQISHVWLICKCYSTIIQGWYNRIKQNTKTDQNQSLPNIRKNIQFLCLLWILFI